MTQNESLNPIKTCQQWIEQSTNSDNGEQAIPKVDKKKHFLIEGVDWQGAQGINILKT